MKLGPALVMTPDLEEALGFYRDALGLKLRDRFADQLVFELGNGRLHVFRCEAPAGPRRRGADASSVLCFEVQDLTEKIRELRDKGVTFLHDRPVRSEDARLSYPAATCTSSFSLTEERCPAASRRQERENEKALPRGEGSRSRRSRAYQSKTMTERASSPFFISSKPSLTCSSLIRWEIISSSFSLPDM